MSDKLPTPKSDIPEENLKNPTPYKQKVDPLNGLPDFVKDPMNYMKIQKALHETRSCGKTHSTPKQSDVCKGCITKKYERYALLNTFGFMNIKIYFAWKKRHNDIRIHLGEEKYQKLISGKS